ncbi:MAG: hypothetical protein HKN62_11385 [Phycisphaerales bacterium]|nr:hypothetical protein [Phycisphaerales bacterium]
MKRITIGLTALGVLCLLGGMTLVMATPEGTLPVTCVEEPVPCDEPGKTRLDGTTIDERNCWKPPVGCLPPPPPPPRCGGPVVPPPHDGNPRLISTDLSVSRGTTLPVGTLQIVTFYDGSTGDGTRLHVEYERPDGTVDWLDASDIMPSTSNRGRIDTYEYTLGACTLTGRFEVRGVTPNGVIDGLAFSLFWRDADGFHLLRSTNPDPAQITTLVGIWPIALNDKAFELRTPQLTTPAGRQQARMMISGAEYMQNGQYLMAIQERAVRMKRTAQSE